MHIESFNSELTEWDILLWTLRHRNIVLYTVQEYRTIYCTVCLHVAHTLYRYVTSWQCALLKVLIALFNCFLHEVFLYDKIKIDIRPPLVSILSDPLLSSQFLKSRGGPLCTGLWRENLLLFSYFAFADKNMKRQFRNHLFFSLNFFKR